MWLEKDQVKIILQHSKTDQHRRGTQVILGACGEQDFCPVSALAEYLTLRRDGSGGFLFRHQDSSLLSRHQFWTVMSRALEAIGLGGQRFCIHYFRIGETSTAAAMGYQEQEIRQIGC